MSTPTLILHHYALSPFSEKIRAMLGYAGIPWQSAVTREFPPRPVLAQLAGGYRKVPVGQIGADVFCDSKLIADEIAALSGKPALSLAAADPAVQDYVRHVDLEIFLACIMQARPLALLRNGGRMNPLDVIRLVIDRVQIGRRSAVKPSSVAKPGRRVREHLADLDLRLQRHDFLFGDEPNHADFSAYHALWFMRDMGGSRLVADHPAVSAWMARMKGFGAGKRQEIAPADALAAAKAATPRPIAPAEAADDRPVAIAPADYAQDAASGRLVGENASRWIIARDVPGLGTIHVHFPRSGYVLTPA